MNNILRPLLIRSYLSVRTALKAVAICAVTQLPATESEKPVDLKGSIPSEPATGFSNAIEVVVSAGRVDAENTLEVPQMISIVDRSELDRAIFIDLNAAIQSEPSVGRAPADGTSNYWNPGFSLRGLGGQRVLTLTDGVRQAGQGIGYGGGFLSLYDPVMVERVEILRGPRSVIYGTDAIGGVVNVLTRQPEQRNDFGINGGLRYEKDGGYNFDRYSGYVDFGNESFGFTGGLYEKDAGRPYVPGDQPNQGSYEQRGAWAQLHFFLNELWTWKLTGNTDQNRDILVSDSPIGPLGRPLLFAIPEYNRSFFGSKLEMDDPGALLEHLGINLSWQQVSREFQRESAYQRPPSPPTSFSPSFFYDAVITDDEVNTYELSLLSRWLLVDDHEITAGIDLGYDEVTLSNRTTTTQLFGPPLPSIVTNTIAADAEQYRIGLFIEDEWTSGQFTLTGGLRLDHFEVENKLARTELKETGLSGNIALLYNYDDVTTYYASIASGFRVPDLGERYQDVTVNIGEPTRVLGNPDLEPERSWNFELGTKHEGEFYRYSAAVFYNDISDFINDELRLGRIAGLETDQFQNAGDAAVYGFEFEGGYRLNKEWQFFANATRTYTDEKNIISVRDWVFNYGIRFERDVNIAWVDRISSTLFLRSVLDSEDTVPGADQVDYHSFTIANWQMSLELPDRLQGSTRIIIGIRNITDESYEEPFFDEEQPERSAFVSVEHRF